MELSFNFSVEETNLILEGLKELQFKKVIQLMRRIESEANTQLQKSLVKEPEPIVEE